MTVGMLGPWPEASGPLGGGVEAVVATLAQSLAATPNVSVHVVTLGHPARTWSEGALTISQVGLQRALRNVTFSAPDRLRLARAAWRLRPDIVHAHGLPDYGYAATRLGVPHVVSVHGVPADEAPHVKGALNRFRWWTLSVRSTQCLVRARHLTVPTEYARERMRGQTHAAIHLVENPVDEEFFVNTNPASDPGPPILLCVSRLIPLKRIEDVIDSFAHIVQQIPDVHLEIAGAGDAAYTDEMRRRAAALPVPNRVRFLGFVEPQALAAVVRRARLLLHTSAQENAPVAIEQALAAGVPVVAAHVGGIPSIVRHGETGFLVPVGNAQGLAEHACTLLTNAAQYAAFSAAARADARQRFHPRSVAAKILTLYDSIVREAGTHPRRHRTVIHPIAGPS
jgi:glycosyltransferase involved in cell wall biosynthesis